MSYILDALRRADSERERDRTAIPGLHAQPMAQVTDDDDRPGRPLPWLGIGVGAAVALLAVIAWTLVSRDSAPEPLPPAATQPAAPPPMAAVQPALPAIVPPSAAPASAAQSPAPVAPPVAQAATPAPRAAAPEPRRAAASAPKAATKAQAAASAASAAASAPTQVQPVYAQKDLPEEIRRALPALTIGGSIYSESAANRFVIINGQLFHENDVLGPDLTLRQIKLKSAVMEFRGYRYELTY